MGRVSTAREELLEVGADLIHSKGYQGVGVQEICCAAGVKKGSFYHFFPSKQELVLEIIDRHWEEMRRSCLEPAFRPDIPPLKRIERYLKLAGAMLVRKESDSGVICGCPFGNLALEMGASDELIRHKVDQVFRSWAAYFEAAIQEAIDAGDADPVDAHVCAEALVAYVSGIALLSKAHNSAAVAQRLGPSAMNLIQSPPTRQ